MRGDAALAAKVLDTFSRQADVLEVKGGLMGGRVLAPDEIRQLARLPAPRRARSPSSRAWWRRRSPGLVRGLGVAASAAWPWRSGRCAGQKEAAAPGRGAGAEEAPAEEAAAAEEPAEEAPAEEAGGRGAGGRGSPSRNQQSRIQTQIQDAEKEAQ